MSRLIYEVLLPLTLMGSAATLVLILLRSGFAKVGKHFSGLLAWCIVLGFYLIPVSSPTVALAIQKGGAALPLPSIAFTADVPQAISESTLKLAVLSPAASLFLWLPIVWAVGFIFSFGMMLVRLGRFSRHLAVQRILVNSAERETMLRQTTSSVCGFVQHHSLKIYWMPGIASPFAHGLIHPAIYLPQRKLTPQEMSLALQHELLHIQRKHLWLKAACEMAVLLHWFNPFVYVLKRQLDAACEINCDQHLTVGMAADQRKSYAQLLFSLAGNNRYTVASTLSRNGRQLSMRLLALRQALPSGQQKFLAVLLALLLLMPCVPAAATCENTVQRTSDSVTMLKSALTHTEDFLPLASNVRAIIPAQETAPENLIQLQWPIPNYRYCSRIEDSGISIVAEPQTEIVAAADGVVLATSDTTTEIGESYGQTVVILHSTAPDISTSYTHCAELYVQPGDTVTAGQVIGTVGNSGMVSGPMCRFQVRIDGTLYNPASWYPDTYFTTFKTI